MDKFMSAVNFNDNFLRMFYLLALLACLLAFLSVL